MGVLSESSEPLTEALYQYGRNLGLAFQIVDDILDFTGSEEVLGKPAGSDLLSGNLAAPVLYAREETPYLATLIEREFAQSGDFEESLALVRASRGIERSRELAAHHVELAVANLSGLPQSEPKRALEALSSYVLSRLY